MRGCCCFFLFVACCLHHQTTIQHQSKRRCWKGKMETGESPRTHTHTHIRAPISPNIARVPESFVRSVRVGQRSNSSRTDPSWRHKHTHTHWSWGGLGGGARKKRAETLLLSSRHRGVRAPAACRAQTNKQCRLITSVKGETCNLTTCRNVTSRYTNKRSPTKRDTRHKDLQRQGGWKMGSTLWSKRTHRCGCTAMCMGR